MRRLLSALLIAGALAVALATSAAAHNLEILDPHTGEVKKEHWIGGPPVPAEAGPMLPPYNVPPSHGKGLVKACDATKNSPAVSILAPAAPGNVVTCEHGGAPPN
jgi:hypothetical protein